LCYFVDDPPEVYYFIKIDKTGTETKVTSGRYLRVHVGNTENYISDRSDDINNVVLNDDDDDDDDEDNDNLPPLVDDTSSDESDECRSSDRFVLYMLI
jgi:hypothetical protein